jgi:hypothetical protein
MSNQVTKQVQGRDGMCNQFSLISPATRVKVSAGNSIV